MAQLLAHMALFRIQRGAEPIRRAEGVEKENQQQRLWFMSYVMAYSAQNPMART